MHRLPLALHADHLTHDGPFRNKTIRDAGVIAADDKTSRFPLYGSMQNQSTQQWAFGGHYVAQLEEMS